MAWRIHLSNQAIQYLQVIPSKRPSLAVWTGSERIQFFDLENGTTLSEFMIPTLPEVARQSDSWQIFVTKLSSPDSKISLPQIRFRKLDILNTDDGKLRVYRQDDDKIFMEADGAEEEITLIGGERLITIALDGALGTFVGLDEGLRLHIYQQNIRVGAFEIGLEKDPDLRPALRIARGGGAIYATDGKRIVVVDNGGKIKRKMTAHYFVGQLSCSPGGGMIITSDMESGVLRAYHGETLTLTHQKFAIDLVAEAEQVQLMADLPPTGTAISAVAAYNRGVFAFAMSGVVCVSSVDAMDEIPRPKKLL